MLILASASPSRRQMLINAGLDFSIELSGVDEDEARAWTLLRAGVEVSWASVDGDEDAVSTCVALHKALDD